MIVMISDSGSAKHSFTDIIGILVIASVLVVVIIAWLREKIGGILLCVYGIIIVIFVIVSAIYAYFTMPNIMYGEFLSNHDKLLITWRDYGVSLLVFGAPKRARTSNLRFRSRALNINLIMNLT